MEDLAQAAIDAALGKGVGFVDIRLQNTLSTMY